MCLVISGVHGVLDVGGNLYVGGISMLNNIKLNSKCSHIKIPRTKGLVQLWY